MFGSVVSEDFYHTFSLVTTAISCLSNLLLVYVLAVTQLAHVGHYRYLLLIFAVVDVLISLVHLALVPAIHMTEFGYIYFGYRFVHENTDLGNWASLIWVALFYQTFVLLAFHYVYRYVMLCNPRWLTVFRQNPWRNWLAVTFIADVSFIGGILLACFIGLLPYELSRNVFAPILMAEYNVDLQAPNKPGYLGIVYWIINEQGQKVWLPHSLFAIGLVILLFFSTAGIIAWCIWRIIGELSDSKIAKMAPATKRLQKQLFNTLLWQTGIPCVTTYAPVAMIFLVPLAGIPLEGFGTVFIMSTALFPILDPYIVIFLISGYRKAFVQMLRKLRIPVSPASSSVVTVSRTNGNQ